MVGYWMCRYRALFSFVAAAVFVLYLAMCRSGGSEPEAFFARTLINLDHLDFLCEDTVVEGDSVTIVHIYSDAPAYNWTDAGGEGIACVDDAARAAVVYLRYYELTEESPALNRSRNLLRCIMVMQAEDGDFFNFIDAERRINPIGYTTKKSFWFWAARGYWALGYGYWIFRGIDTVYAEQLKTAFLRCKRPLSDLMEHYGEIREFGGRLYPTWLMNSSGSDATSEFLLGVAYYLKIEKDEELALITERLVDGLLLMQMNDEPYIGAFLSWPGVWHAYANCQTQALAMLGLALDKPEWIAVAEREANGWYRRLLEVDMIRSFELDETVKVFRFPQIAYDIRPIVLGLIGLYEATGRETYARTAGLAAAWFFGRNPAERMMFDSETGRVYDGINSPDEININSGAESTIEGLMTLLEVASDHAVYDRVTDWVGKNEAVAPIRE